MRILLAPRAQSQVAADLELGTLQYCVDGLYAFQNLLTLGVQLVADARQRLGRVAVQAFTELLHQRR